MHAVQSEVLFDLQGKHFLQFPDISDVFDFESRGRASLCNRCEGHPHIRIRFTCGSILRGPVTSSVHHDHFSVHILKCAQSDVTVLQQFFDRGNGTGIAQGQSLQCRYLIDFHF